MEIEQEEVYQAPSRENFLGSVILLYFVPLAALSVYVYYSQDRWSFLSLGLMLTSVGTFIFLGLLRKLEDSYAQQKTIVERIVEAVPDESTLVETPPPPAPDYTPYLEQIQKLEESQANWIRQTDNLTDNLQNVIQEKGHLVLQNEALQHELNNHKQQSQAQVEELRSLLSDHQNGIADLRENLDRKQQQVQHFESKVRDLNYEIKTLLQLSEKIEEPIQVHLQEKKRDILENQLEDSEVQTPEEALMELKRCVDVAQRIAGNTPFSSNSRFRDISLDSIALDLRHLYDRLKEFHACTVFVFAPKENKMLFVNDNIQKLLGITPEKFLQTFSEILHEGHEEWKTALNQLTFKNDAKVNLSLKTRTGQEISVQGMIGAIPTGIFRQYVIGVLF